MSEYKGTYEFVFFHDQKKGEIIVIMNGKKHVFDDGVAKAVKAERERIIELLEGTDLLKTIESGAFVNYADTAIELIKGEQK